MFLFYSCYINDHLMLSHRKVFYGFSYLFFCYDLYIEFNGIRNSLILQIIKEFS